MTEVGTHVGYGLVYGPSVVWAVYDGGGIYSGMVPDEYSGGYSKWPVEPYMGGEDVVSSGGSDAYDTDVVESVGSARPDGWRGGPDS